MIVTSIVLALMLSIDSFGIGITYGLKGTKISLIPKLILFIIMFTISYLSLKLGHLIASLISEQFVTALGVVLLVGMGIWIIFQGIYKKEEKKCKEVLRKTKIHQFIIKSLGITIQIIRKPSTSDLDGSHTIDIKEAIYLGFAMSIDSLCSGIGISTFGVSPILFPILVATFQNVLLSLGNQLGKKIKYMTRIPDNVFTMISGILLIIIGISRPFL